jgi:uncharacterized membrane protein YbhN (UPF0104 family)
MNLRRLTSIVAKIAVSFALLWLVSRGIDVDALAGRVSRLSPVWLFVSVLAGLAQILLQAPRWRAAVLAAGTELGLLQAFRYCMIGMFFNQGLPALGGDAARIWLLGRRSGWRSATYSAIVDRGFGFLALAALIVASLPFSLNSMSEGFVRSAVVALGCGALVCALCFVSLGLFRWPWLERFALFHHLHSCAALAARLLFNWRSGPWIAAASIGIHALSPVAAYAAGRSIQAEASFVQMLLLVPPVMLITMLPVSIAGWGLREASMTIVFTSAGLAQADGFLLSLLIGIAQLAVGVIGGALWLAMPAQDRLAAGKGRNFER